MSKGKPTKAKQGKASKQAKKEKKLRKAAEVAACAEKIFARPRQEVLTSKALSSLVPEAKEEKEVKAASEKKKAGDPNPKKRFKHGGRPPEAPLVDLTTKYTVAEARATHGFDMEDAWNVDGYLYGVAANMLHHYALHHTSSKEDAQELESLAKEFVDLRNAWGWDFGGTDGKKRQRKAMKKLAKLLPGLWT